MKPKDFTKIINKLKKVFEVTQDINDHYFYHIYYKGKRIMHTKRSHGGIKPGDVHLIAKQLKLNTTGLNSYRICTLTNDQYILQLKDQKIID